MLALPLKQTKPVEWDKALHRFVSLNYSDHVAEEHKSRFQEVHELRAKFHNVSSVNEKTAISLKDTLVKYHALLMSMGSRFGESAETRGTTNMNVAFEWRDSFHSHFKSSQYDIRYERAAVLWNIAAVISYLGTMTRRDEGEGLKKACHLFQQAAHTIGMVADIARVAEWEGCTVDLSSESLYAMQLLMLAQAQKCFHEKADRDGMRNSVVAKLAMHAAVTYDDVLDRMRMPKLKSNLEKGWPAVAEWQSLYFHALAQWHSAEDHLAAHEYGKQVGRLAVANDKLSQLLKLAKAAPPDVLERYSVMGKKVAAKYAEAAKDNDTAYNELVPAPRALDAIEPKAVAKAAKVSELDPCPGVDDPFKELVPFEVMQEASVFTSRVDDAVREIKDAAHSDAQVATTELDSMDLPQALQACETDGDIPHKLQDEIERTQRAGGTEALEAALTRLGQMAGDARTLAMSIESVLDVEAGADAQVKQAHGTLPSSAFIAELGRDLSELKAKLDNAASADAELGSKFAAKREALRILELPISVLREQVPAAEPGAKLGDLNCTKALRALLDQLDSLRGERDKLVRQAREQASREDISNALVHRGERPVAEVHEEALSTYDVMMARCSAMQEEQAALLEAIRAENEEFTRARIAEGSNEGRQDLFRALNGAVSAYDEMGTQFSEGVAFYTGMLDRLSELQQRVADMAEARAIERRDMLAHAAQQQQQQAAVAAAQAAQAQVVAGGEAVALPHANSMGHLALPATGPQLPATGPQLQSNGSGVGLCGTAASTPPAAVPTGTAYGIVAPGPPSAAHHARSYATPPPPPAMPQQAGAGYKPPPLQPPQPPQLPQPPQPPQLGATASAPHYAPPPSAAHVSTPHPPPQLSVNVSGTDGRQEEELSPDMLRALELSRLESLRGPGSGGGGVGAGAATVADAPPPPPAPAFSVPPPPPPPVTFSAPPPPLPPTHQTGVGDSLVAQVAPAAPPIPYYGSQPTASQPPYPLPSQPAQYQPAPPPVPPSQIRPPARYGAGAPPPPPPAPLPPQGALGSALNPVTALNPAPLHQPPPQPPPPPRYTGY